MNDYPRIERFGALPVRAHPYLAPGTIAVMHGEAVLVGPDRAPNRLWRMAFRVSRRCEGWWTRRACQRAIRKLTKKLGVK